MVGTSPAVGTPRDRRSGKSLHGSGREAAAKRHEFPVPPRRRVKIFSKSQTGITLPKQRQRTENSKPQRLPMPSDDLADSAPGRRTWGDSDDVTALQSQLAAMGIELSLDALRNRVRLAEQRLNSHDKPKGLRGAFPLRLPVPRTEGTSERPGTARQSADEAIAQELGRVKRPSTARARLEHGVAARPALSPVWAEGSDSDNELVYDGDMSTCLPDIDSLHVDDSTWTEDGTPEESIFHKPNEDTAHNAHGILTKREWEHGSLWEWGNPNKNSEIESTPQAATRSHGAGAGRDEPGAVLVGAAGYGAWSGEDVSQTFGLIVQTASHVLTGESARSASPSVCPTARRPPRTAGRPATPRSMPSSRTGSKSSVGLSPRTNLRQSMGMWTAPNTPGPGAYNISPRARKGATFSKDRKLAPTSIERFLESTPSPAAYHIKRPFDFGRKSLHAVQAWGLGPQFPPSRDYVEATQVPGPKYDIVKPFYLGCIKGFSFGSGPQAPLTAREVEAIKVPGPGEYNVVVQRNTHAPQLGSGTLTPRSDMLYIDPKTPGPAAYNIDRALTPRHIAHARSANISRADSATVIEMKEMLSQMKSSPSVFDYETGTGVEIGADNAARRSAPYFSRSSGRDLPATGDPIRELQKVPSAQHYHPSTAGGGGGRGNKFGCASRNSVVTGF